MMLFSDIMRRVTLLAKVAIDNENTCKHFTAVVRFRDRKSMSNSLK